MSPPPSAHSPQDADQATGVSVVIPSFNYAHYLPEALASVLAQTWSGLEAIVVDDGSSDNTGEIVATQTDPRVRYVWQKNAGLSAARNTGIREARFPFIAFLDADDRWNPDLLATVMQRFSDLGSEFALIAAHTARMDANGCLVQHQKSIEESDREMTARDFVMRNRPFSSSIVARREVFATCGGFDTTLRSSEDRDMWIRIAAHRRVWFVGRPLGLIRRHPENMSKNAKRMKQNSRTVLVKAYRERAVPRSDIPFWLRVFSVHYFQIAWTHFDERRLACAFTYMFLSLALWPCFLDVRTIYERPLFRLRSLGYFLLRIAR